MEDEQRHGTDFRTDFHLVFVLVPIRWPDTVSHLRVLDVAFGKKQMRREERL